MPEKMAVHFAPDGQVNRFDSSVVYAVMISVIVCFVAAIMLGISFFTSFVTTHMPESVNIPNRDYWLNEENRPITVRRICSNVELSGVGTMILFLLVQWEVFQANLTVPPGQPNINVLMCGTGVLLAVITFDCVRMLRSFRLPKEKTELTA